MTFSFLHISISNVVVLASMLSRGVDGDAVSSFFFLSSYLKFRHFFLLRGKLRFLQIFISVAWLLPMNVLKLEGFLVFFQNFPKDVFRRKFLFPWGRDGDAKVVFFLAGSFSRNREVFESDGLVRRFFFFFNIQMLMRKSDVFEVGPDT